MMEFIDSLPRFYKLDAYDRRLIILEWYLAKYADFHLDVGDPVGKLLESSPKEEFRENSRLSLRVSQYMANEIREAYGFNLSDFLTLPTYFMEDLLAKQRLMLKERREVAEKAKQEAARSKDPFGLPNLGAGMHSFNPN